MASRRTRIKGIANIPQRRKTTNSTANTEEPAIKADPEIIVKEEINLTNDKPNGNDCIEESQKEISEIKPHQIDEEKDEKPDIKVEDDCQFSEKEDTQLEQKDNKNPEPKPTAAFRRKFIKPSVSLNTIKRKPSESENAKNDKLKQNTPTNKIIILNEVITYPNQDQQIVINNYHHGVIVPLKVEADSKPVLPLQSGSLKSPQNLPDESQNSTDSERPIPPPSPTKLNRSRIKAVPRLGQRHTSFSASESEDETRKNYRHRNDSVCSTTSTHPDNSSVFDCPSPQKPKEFNSVIQRKCRRTEQSRKLAEARRDFYIKFGNKKPDRQKLTMIDLIFYNPTTNQMNHDNKLKKEEKEEIDDENDENFEKDKTNGDEKIDDPHKSESDEENEIPAPQIKIGPQGEIVVDEQSLVIESKAIKKSREELEKTKVVSADLDTGYGIYKRAKRSKDWSKNETLKFYKALNTIGTDFTLMCELFPRRTRRELKMKFKKEERINRALIDKAVMQPCGFDFNDFKHEVEMEEKELMALEEQKERERQLKKESKKRKAGHTPNDNPEKIAKIDKKDKKRKTLDIMDVLDDDESDADKSENESFCDDDASEDKLMQNIQRPTRSGRIPKTLTRYRPEPKSRAAEPGSLIVVASTGDNGEPVYRVCMVTGEHSRQQIGDDMESLSKASLKCKENGCIKSIFTLSTSISNMKNGNEDVAIPEEHNYTIPEEHNVTIPEEQNITIHEEHKLPIHREYVTISEEHNVTISEEHNVTILQDHKINRSEEDNIICEEHNVTIPEDHKVTNSEELYVTFPADVENEIIVEDVNC